MSWLLNFGFDFNFGFSFAFDFDFDAILTSSCVASFENTTINQATNSDRSAPYVSSQLKAYEVLLLTYSSLRSHSGIAKVR